MIDFQMLYWGLEELASEEMQTNLWLGNCKGELSTFEEAVCHVFNDSGLGSELDSSTKRNRHGEEFLEVADDLRNALSRLTPSEFTPLELIKTKEMEAVRSLSRIFMDLIVSRKLHNLD